MDRGSTKDSKQALHYKEEEEETNQQNDKKTTSKEERTQTNGKQGKQ